MCCSVERSGDQPNSTAARLLPDTKAAASPALRGPKLCGTSWPVAALHSAITSLTEKPVPVPKLNTRLPLIELLLSAKLYIDFGNHPGKDRIPREAAALGCIIMTNRRGSALNDVDVPINPDLKIDDTSNVFAAHAAERIEDVMVNYLKYHEELASYRKAIIEEKSVFFESVAGFVQAMKENTGAVG